MTDAEAYFLSFPRFGNKAGLDRIAALMAALGNPQEQLRCVHIAGTNGKGSTTTMLAAMARAAGLRTGSFTSPYITCFRERMQINGQPIPEEDLEVLARRLRPLTEEMARQGIQLCHFEVVTAAAFCWFAEQKCDLVCLETGLGGRLDSTNLLTSKSCALSVITALGFDHMELLGDTMEKIAFEKAGIIKPGVPVVCYPEQPEEALGVIFAAAAMQGSAVHLPSLASLQDGSESVFAPAFSYGGRDYRLGLLGEHQFKNAVTAITAAQVLAKNGFAALTPDIIARGVAEGILPARLELLPQKNGGPRVLLDGAHNGHGCSALAAFLQRARREIAGPITLVMGMMADKNVDESLAVLLPRCDAAFAAPADNPRALSPEALAQRMSPHCGEVTPCPTLAAALEQAARRAGKEGLVVVCGSLYLAAQARELWLDGKN